MTEKVSARCLSVFDLDHTLVKVNTSYIFGNYLYRTKYFSFKDMIYLVLCYFRHKKLGMSLQEVHSRIFDRIFLGRSAVSMSNHLQSFLDVNLDHIINPTLLDRLRQAQKENHLVIILSSSPDFLVESIGSRLGVDISIGTSYQTNAQKYFSEISQVINGQEKADFILQLSTDRDVPLENVVAYSDSVLDLPLLETVGTAVVVNPDKKLRTIAQYRNWEIVD